MHNYKNKLDRSSQIKPHLNRAALIKNYVKKKRETSSTCRSTLFSIFSSHLQYSFVEFINLYLFIFFYFRFVFALNETRTHNKKRISATFFYVFIPSIFEDKNNSYLFRQTNKKKFFFPLKKNIAFRSMLFEFMLSILLFLLLLLSSKSAI